MTHPYPGSWNAQHPRKPAAMSWVYIVVAAVIVALILAGWASRERRLEECAELGGELVTGYRSPDLCVKDGLIVKVWR